MQNFKVKTIRRDHLNEVQDGKILGKGIFGKCSLKMYQGQMVATKEFRNGVSKEEVVREASILSRLSHPGVPFVLGMDLSMTPYIMVMLFYGISMRTVTLHHLLN